MAERKTRKLPLRSLHRFLALLDLFNALLGFIGEFRLRITNQNFVVVDQSAVPLSLFFVESSHNHAPPCLLSSQCRNVLLRFGDARILRIQSHEIRKCSDGLASDALVVFRGRRLLQVGHTRFVDRIRGNLFPIVILISRRLIRLHCGCVIGLFLSRLTNVHLRLRCHLAVRSVLDQLFVHLHGLIHRREKRNHAPQFEPLARQVTIRDDILPLHHLIVVRRFRVFLHQLLIRFKCLLILPPFFLGTANEILRFRCVVGKWPHSNDPPGRFGRELVVLFIERFLRDLELIFRTRSSPWAAAIRRLIAPAFAGSINQWSGSIHGHQEDSGEEDENTERATLHKTPAYGTAKEASSNRGNCSRLTLPWPQLPAKRSDRSSPRFLQPPLDRTHPPPKNSSRGDLRVSPACPFSWRAIPRG